MEEPQLRCLKEEGHTPGPWQLEGNWEADAKHIGGWISTMHPMPLFELNPVTGEWAEIIANARLIAASPEYHQGAQAFLEYEKAAEAGNDVAAMMHYDAMSKYLRAGFIKATSSSRVSGGSPPFPGGPK